MLSGVGVDLAAAGHGMEKSVERHGAAGKDGYHVGREDILNAEGKRVGPLLSLSARTGAPILLVMCAEVMSRVPQQVTLAVFRHHDPPTTIPHTPPDSRYAPVVIFSRPVPTVIRQDGQGGSLPWP